MNILYIAFARMPTEKAHGLTIAKSCEAFARAGADVTLVVPRRATPIAGDVFSAYGLERNFKVREIRVPDLIGRFGGSPLAFWIQYTLFYSAVKLSLLFASRKTVLYTRDTMPILFSWLGYKTVFECHVIPARRTLFFLIARRAARVITISKALKDAFVRAGFGEGRILVAPSGVDLSTFDTAVSKEEARKRLNLPQDARIAVYTGNFTTMGEDKGMSDTITALKDASEVLFVAVGGSEKDVARYASQAKQAGVAGRVFLFGHTTQAQLAVYQKAADVLLMPFPDTPHYRNHMSPVKLFEYMAARRSIIATDLPTIREVLSEANAHIVSPGDVAAIARALKDVFTQPEEAHSRAERAYTEVARFTWSERTRRILAFIGTGAA